MEQVYQHIYLNPEKVAYWYFRLNGFFQIENFVVHPERRGAQRTDADLLAVRFPYRAERLIDNPEDTMADDALRLGLHQKLVDVVIAEVKTGECALNGPWTREERQNVQRVLAAIGCIPHSQIQAAAEAIYQNGVYLADPRLRVRLVAVGREQSAELIERFPSVTQLVWSHILEFIWNRFHTYQNQKTQVDQWDVDGRHLKKLADDSDNPTSFAEEALRLMGVRSAT